MKKRSESKREIRFIVLFFVITAIIAISSKFLSLYQINIMHNITTDIYEHPLKVSNAALNVKLDIYKIHSYMKDIVHSSSNKNIPNLIKKINQHEKNVNKNLEIIEKNILGEAGLSLINETKLLFKDCHSKRNVIIFLIKKRQTTKALEIINNKGTKHSLSLENSASKLYDYAHSKAIEFKNKSETTFKRLEIINFTASIILLIILVLFAYYILKRITKYIDRNEHLKIVLSLVRNVEQFIVREKDTKKLIQKSCDILSSQYIYNNTVILTYDDNDQIEHIACSDSSDAFVEFKTKIVNGWIPYCSKQSSDNKSYSYVEDITQTCKECPLSEKYLNKNAISIALKYNNKLYGYLIISLNDKYINNQEELSLLDEIASDIAYALHNIKVENSLIESQKRYHDLFRKNRAIALLIDPQDAKIIDANDKAINFYGYSKEDLLSLKISDINTLTPEEIAKEMKLAKLEKRDMFNFKHKLANGDIRDVEVYSGPIEIDNKTILYSIIFDITNQLELKSEHTKTQERLSLVLESSTDGIWDWDLLTNLVYFSPRWKEIIGYKDDELENTFKTWEDRVHPDDKETTFMDIEASQNIKIKYFRSIFRLKHKDGRWVWIEARGKTIFDNNGKPVRMLGSHTDITEQKHAEKELKDNVRRFKNIFSQTYQLSGIVSLDGILLNANKMSLDFIGVEESDVIGKPFWDTQWWEHSDEQKEWLRNSIMNIKSNEIVQREVTHISKDGDVHYFDFSLRPVLDENNKILYLIPESRDITKQKEAEQELLISNDKFKKAFNNTPNLIVISNVNSGKIYDINKTFEKVMGYEREEVIGNTSIDLEMWVDINDRTIFTDTLCKYGSVEAKINSFYTKNKDILIFELYANIVLIANKEYILTVANDITKQYKAEKSLEQKKKELETIFNEAPEPIAIHNEDGNILMINKIWEEITGYSHNEIDTIDKWTSKVAQNDSSNRKHHIENLYSITNRIDEGEFEITTKNGDKRIWTFSSAPLGTIDNKKVLVSLATDITELKKKDEMLIAQSRSAAMGEMIGMIAHQWRQPISGIGMDANNMLLDIELDIFKIEDAKEYANSIIDQTQNLSKTIDDFRNFFKPDKEILKVNIEDIINETFNIVKDSLKHNNIEFKTSYESNIEVEAYPRELMQVFVNIITNAKDSLVQHNTKDAQITIKVYEDEKYLNTQVCDNGVGIKEDILSKIFDPYFTTKDESSGTGLGLYMSKMIIEEHLNGKIEAINNDIGVCFRVRLLKDFNNE